MKNYIQPGKTVTLTAPTGGVVAGNGYKIGQLFVVAQNSAAEGEDFEGVTEGVFELPKTSANTWSQGALLYWNNSTGALTTTASGNMLVANGLKAGANGETTAVVRLNGVGRANEA